MHQLWRGNSAVLVRVLPFAGIHYAAHEQFSAWLAPAAAAAPRPSAPARTLSPLRKFASGAGAGATSTLLTYPLDLARARMAVSAERPESLIGVLRALCREAGPQAMFRGLTPTLVGIVPYSGTA